MEFGERPDFTAGDREKNRWRLARELATQGEYDLIDDQIYVTAYSSLHKMKYDKVEDNTPLKECCGVWLYGVPGSGKSFDARTRYGNNNFYVKESFDQWFDGYTGQYAIIFEDIDPDMCKDPKIIQRLKTWTDKWPFPCQTKGGMINAIRPKRFIVTSNFSIEECFPHANGGNLEAVKRRFQVIRYEFPYVGALQGSVLSQPPGTLPIFNQITRERMSNEMMYDERSPTPAPKVRVRNVDPPPLPRITRQRPYTDKKMSSPGKKITFKAKRNVMKLKVVDLTQDEDESDSDSLESNEERDDATTLSMECCSDCGYVEDDCTCFNV